MTKRYFIAFLLTICITFTSEATENSTKIKFAITRTSGDRFNDSFRRYSPLAKYYKEQGCEPFLLDLNKIIHGRYNTQALYLLLSKYHVVLLETRDEGIDQYSSKKAAIAKDVGQALKMYVENGGGLIIQVSAVRYPNDQDETFWNSCLKPFGIQLLHEGIYDSANNLKDTIKPNTQMTFSLTSNITEHPVTTDVKGLLLPLESYISYPGTPPYKFTDAWTIVIRAEKTAKSYKNDQHNCRFSPKITGTYTSAPPVVAVRNFGKGRMVAISINRLFTGINYKNEYWGNQVEFKGANGKPSNSVRLIANAVKWTAQNALKDPSLGKAKPAPYKTIVYPEKVSWDKKSFTTYTNKQAFGIWGLHTDLTDGEGSVADYSAAAKDAGLAFIVFSDPLELLTPEKMKKLKADCEAVSNDSFYACPGIEFTDGVGNRWVLWGERLAWPLKSFQKGKYTYQQWTGKIIKHYGKYIMTNGFTGNALISYKQLLANKAYPENMWWFFNIIPKAYEGDQLIADNSDQMQFALQDLRWFYPITFNRIKSPTAITNALKSGVTSFKDIQSARKVLNQRGNPFHAAKNAQQYISTGNIKITFQVINEQMENNWLYTRGAQRAKCKFTAEAPAGIKSVKVIDAFSGIIRSFNGSNAEKLTREFELVHSRKYSLWLEVTDSEGNIALSHSERIWCYKQDLFRCGDNLNILGPIGMYWHPDRNQMFPLIKKFHNAELVSVQGWDRANADCPLPEAWPLNRVEIAKIGDYPPRAQTTSGARMKVNLAGHDMQYVTMIMKDLVENCDTEKRGGPATSSIARKVQDNEYFDRIDEMFAFRDNTDFFKIWNYRRLREGLEDFEGSLILHQGEFKFKQDITLTGNTPIKLFKIKYPFEAGKQFNKLVVDDLERGKISITINNMRKKYSGTVRPGGYLAVMNSPVGYIGIFAPHDQELSYEFSWPNILNVGLGSDGMEINKGQVIKYRYIAAILTDTTDSAEQLQQLAKTYNLDNGNNGYPLKVKVGTLVNAELFLSLKATSNETAFTAGPAEIIIDLPIRVSGIQDNGCAAIYSSRHPWFNFVPVLDGTALLQESIKASNSIWIGNVFIADNPNIKMTLVKDGQAEDKKPFLEIHNPTKQDIKANVYSPKNTPVFGGRSFCVDIPAENSIQYYL